MGFEEIVTFFYNHPDYTWGASGALLVLLGFIIAPVRMWFVYPGIACLATGILILIGVIPISAVLIQSLCALGFIAVFAACHE